MNIHLGILRLITFLLTGLIIAILVGATWVYSSQLPDPEYANRDELVRWLVTRDLARESANTRKILALRLDSEFVDVDWAALGEQMSAEHRRQLWANVPLLLEPWFMDKLDDYSKRDSDQRQACIDAIIDRMCELSGMDCLRENGQSRPAPKLKEILTENVVVWEKQAEPAQKQRMAQFMAAIQARWLIRTLSGKMPNAQGSH